MKKIALCIVLCFNSALASTTSYYNIQIKSIDNQGQKVDFDIQDIDSITESNYDRTNYPKNKTRVLINLLPVVVGNTSSEAEAKAKKARQEILDGEEYTLNKYPIPNEQIINIYYNAETKEMLLPKYHNNQYVIKLEKNIDNVIDFINKKYNKFNILEFDIAGSGSAILIDNDRVQNSDKLIELLLYIGKKYQRINIDFLICNSSLFTNLYKIIHEKNTDNKIINISLYSGSICLEHYYGSYDDKKIFDFISKINKKPPFLIQYKDIPSNIIDIINSGQNNYQHKNKFRIIFNRLLLLDKKTKEISINNIQRGNNICPVFKEEITKKALHVF